MIAGSARDEIRRRLIDRIDLALASEEPPVGIDAEILSAAAASDESDDSHADSYSLWAAVTALTQETRLQGRAFKELKDALGEQAAKADREQQKEIERRCRKEALEVLIDLRDRLRRGLDSAKSPLARGGWLARFFSAPAAEDERVAALIRGYEIALERLDEALEQNNAREIRAQGEIFDPRRMNAVDKQESSAVPAGTVLEVYRAGYEWNGEVFRPAQVKVSCLPAGAKEQ